MSLHETTVAKQANEVLPSSEGSGSPVVFEQNIPFSFAYFEKDKRLLPMQSLRRPQEEAQRIVNNWLKDTQPQSGLYILLGITNLHLITEFLEKLGNGSELLVIEPSKEILNSFIDNNELDFINSYDAKFTILGPQQRPIAKTFRKYINACTQFSKGIFITPANSRFRPILTDVQNELITQVKLEALDRVTTAKFSDEWLQNCLINLPELISSPGINQFYECFNKTDCLVVCAGPSLNDSLELIREKQKDCFIICVGTALKPLLASNIQPDLTIVVDSDPKVYKQFEGLEELKGYLLGTHTIFPGIYQHFKNRSICFNSLASYTFADWLKDGGIDHGDLHVGGTVSLSAIDCAIRFNFRNIFVFGLDLAYADDGTSHAKNSMYEGQRANKGLIEIPGNWNKKVKTTKQFANYVEILNGYLEENISGYRKNFYNVNNSGAQFKHINVITPEKASKLIQDANQDFKEILKHKFTLPENFNIEKLCNSSLDELMYIKTTCEKLLKEMENGQFPDELDSFEDYLKSSKVNLSLTGPAIQAWCMNLNSQTSDDPFEMTRNFLEQLSGATEWVEGLLKNSYDRFKNQKKGVR